MGVNGGEGEGIQRPGARLVVRMIIGPASKILILSLVGDWQNNCPTIFCPVCRQEERFLAKSRYALASFKRMPGWTTMADEATTDMGSSSERVVELRYWPWTSQVTERQHLVA